MRWVLSLLVTAFIGCASGPEQKPIGTKPEPAYVRHITSKTHMLYTYKLRQDGPTGYELAEVDAARLCRSKWGMGVAQKTQPSCGVYNTSPLTCAVTFQCK